MTITLEPVPGVQAAGASGSVIRGAAAFATFLAAYFFTYWIGAALLAAVGVGFVVALPLALICAFFASRYVWRRSASWTGGWMASAATGALLTGAIGFCGGFFGPMIFAPGANQGPMLGIFITGPLGFLLGGIGGAIYGVVRKP